MEYLKIAGCCAAWIALCACACGAVVAFLANCPKEDNGGYIEPKIKKAVRLANKTTEQGERETALRLARRC